MLSVIESKPRQNIVLKKEIEFSDKTDFIKVAKAAEKQYSVLFTVKESFLDFQLKNKEIEIITEVSHKISKPELEIRSNNYFYDLSKILEDESTYLFLDSNMTKDGLFLYIPSKIYKKESLKAFFDIISMPQNMKITIFCEKEDSKGIDFYTSIMKIIEDNQDNKVVMATKLYQLIYDYFSRTKYTDEDYENILNLKYKEKTFKEYIFLFLKSVGNHIEDLRGIKISKDVCDLLCENNFISSVIEKEIKEETQYIVKEVINYLLNKLILLS